MIEDGGFGEGRPHNARVVVDLGPTKGKSSFFDRLASESWLPAPGVVLKPGPWAILNRSRVEKHCESRPVSTHCDHHAVVDQMGE